MGHWGQKPHDGHMVVRPRKGWFRGTHSAKHSEVPDHRCQPVGGDLYSGGHFVHLERITA